MSSYFKFSRNSLLVVNIDGGAKVQSRFCNRVAKLTGNRFGKINSKVISSTKSSIILQLEIISDI